MKKLYISRRLMYKFGFIGKHSSFPFLRLTVLLVLLVAAVAFSLGRIGSLAVQIGASRLENSILHECNAITARLLAEQGITYSSVINQEKSDGRITALSTDFAAVNRLKTQLSQQISTYLNSLEQIKTDVPFGAILANDIMTGWGFKIPAYIAASGSADVEFCDSFDSGGLNQTRHRLMLRITINATVYGTANRENMTVICDVPVAETVIVGDASGIILQKSVDNLKD